jgi:hypothetical protein
MKRGIIILVGIVAVIALIGYVYLGGFNEVKIAEMPFSGYTLAGFAYKGKATDRDFEKIFEKVSNDRTRGKIKGTLAAIYYQTHDEAKGQVNAFIGVIVKDSSVDLPDKYTSTVVNGTKTVQAVITSHPAVAPAPDKLKQQLKNYAWENKLQLQGLVIEKYLDLRNIVVEIPLKESNKTR